MTTIMVILMVIYLLVGSVFHDEIKDSGYLIYFTILGFIVLTLGFVSLIAYYISKKKSK